MNKRQSTTAFSANLSKEATPPRPNIVYFMCDDLGYGEIQVLNPKRGKIPTPHIDRFITEGMTFTDAHGASAVCTPTRYGLMTGRYPWRTRLQSSVMQDNAPSLIAEDRLTVGELLRSQGYQTAMFGKWHLGVNYTKTKPADDATLRGPQADRIGWTVNDSPVTRGFDYFYGFHHSGSMSTVIENDRVIDSYHPVDMLPELTRRASDYIHEHAATAQAGQPFFLYIPVNSPHAPVVPSPAFVGKSGLNDHADFVMETDWAFGEILKAIETAGLTDNTLVIFTSDNGTSAESSTIRELESKGHFPSGYYRGYKSDLWDGGHRVPFSARWPGVVTPASTCNQLICLNDLLATLAELFSVTLPPDAGEDSVSILPLLHGEDFPVRDSVVHHSFHGRFAIRNCDWKFVLAHGSGGWTYDDQQAAQNGLPPTQLYDMKNDWQETNNLESKHPEITNAMLETLKIIVANGRSTPGPEQQNDVPVDIWKNSHYHQ